MRPTLLAVLLLASAVGAQSQRYELGARLKAFEAEWDKQPDKDARKRALKGLPDVTGQFFSLQFGKAGETLDTARFALLSDKPPSDAVLWATSLYPDVKVRLVTGDEVEVSVKPFYTVKAERPKGAVVRFSLDGKTWTEAGEKLPANVTVKVPKGEEVVRGDATLIMEVVADAKTLVKRTVTVSTFQVPEAERLVLGSEFLKGLPDKPTLESASIRERVSLLQDLVGGIIPESDVPAAKRYEEAKAMSEAVAKGKPYFTPDRPGDHWITVPTGEKGKTLTRCRLFVPEKLDAKKPVPLVLALHGAGGSENLFFEGYGAGHIVKLCKERGWLLVAPGSGLGFGLTPAPPFGDIIDELAKRYPVDAKRVYIVGHSMGASMTVDAIQKNPGKFAAAACLGGAGTIRKAEAFDGLPLFVGVGDKDFALMSSKALHAAAEKTKAKATLKEYPDVEHLVIVREALGDVFESFDKTK